LRMIRAVGSRPSNRRHPEPFDKLKTGLFQGP
jgi:hypothetical protein